MDDPARGTSLSGDDAVSAADSDADGGPARPTTGSRDRGRPWDVPVWLDRLAGWSWRLAAVGVAGFVVLRLFWILRLVTIPVLFALVLTALLWPARRMLSDRGVPAVVASAGVLLVLGAVVSAVVWLASVGVGQQLAGDRVWEDTRQEVEAWLMDGPLDLTAEQIDEYESRATSTIASGAISVGVDRARLVVELVGATILTAILLFFFLKDGPQMWQFLSRRLEVRRRAIVDRAGRASFAALSGYARGVAITGVIDGIAVGVVMTLLGVPLAIPLALLTSFAAFIPIVGATVVGALSTVVALVTVGPRAAVILAVATLIIQQVEGDLVLPIAMGTQVRLHPAAVLIVLALGGAAAGILGAFVAVPLAAMASAAGRELRRPTEDHGARPWPPAAPRSTGSGVGPS